MQTIVHTITQQILQSDKLLGYLNDSLTDIFNNLESESADKSKRSLILEVVYEPKSGEESIIDASIKISHKLAPVKKSAGTFDLGDSEQPELFTENGDEPAPPPPPVSKTKRMRKGGQKAIVGQTAAVN